MRVALTITPDRDECGTSCNFFEAQDEKVRYCHLFKEFLVSTYCARENKATRCRSCAIVTANAGYEAPPEED